MCDQFTITDLAPDASLGKLLSGFIEGLHEKGRELGDESRMNSLQANQQMLDILTN